MKTALAIDVGSSSGKALMGIYDDHQGLSWTEVHRFAHAIKHGEVLSWDIDTISKNLFTCVDKARAYLREHCDGAPLDSVSVDTWGVDYVWLNDDRQLVGGATCYRDPRHVQGFDTLRRTVDDRTYFALTGNQPDAINTSSQLVGELTASSPAEEASTFALLPDYFAALLGAKLVAGAGIVSTTGLANPSSTQWEQTIQNAVGLPASYYPPIVAEGTVVGTVADSDTKIIRAGSHDTACAVAAIDNPVPGTAFISCGSWSIAGMVTADPVLSDTVFEAGLTNETCVNGDNRLLLNMTGTWLLQESRRQWKREGKDYSFDDMSQMAEDEPSLGVVIDPNEPSLTAPGDVPGRINDIVRERYGIELTSVGQTVRVIVESLAAAHARIFAVLADETGYQPTSIAMVGGGIKDHLLCQLTADACNLPVVAGPVEASALGSILTQLNVLGVDTTALLEKKTYHPQSTTDWTSLQQAFDEAYSSK